MIRHIVLIRFRPEVTESRVGTLFAELREIEEKVPGLLSITAGRSESPEQMERGYMHGFVVDFEDWEGLAAYQEHPDHRRLGGKLVDHATGGKDGILCFDLDTTGSGA
jgi:quinol monooxygenase YgiN